MTATLPMQRRIDEIAAELAPDVIRIRFNEARDWSEDPAIYFRVVLADDATIETTRSRVALAEGASPVAAPIDIVMSMVDSELLQALELLTPDEQQALLAVAEYLKHQRASGAEPSGAAAGLLAELAAAEPMFASQDRGLSPARLAARRFMRENPTLMRLLAQ